MLPPPERIKYNHHPRPELQKKMKESAKQYVKMRREEELTKERFKSQPCQVNITKWSSADSQLVPK